MKLTYKDSVLKKIQNYSMTVGIWDSFLSVCKLPRMGIFLWFGDGSHT